MFQGLELHLCDGDEKILINLDNVNAIYQQSKKTQIYVGGVIYRVKESYADIMEAMGNYYNLGDA